MSANSLFMRGQTVLGHAYNVKAMAKAISEWASNQPMGDTGQLDIDTGDIIAMSGLIVIEADRVIDVID